MSFTVLKDDIFFTRLKPSDSKKGNYVVVEFIQHNPRSEAQSEDSCDHAYKNSVSPTNCNVKETLWHLKKNLRCNRKATFHYKGKGNLQEVFRAGLNEIKYDYVDSKQHFYLQYHVAATDMKALCKKQTTLQAVAYLGFTAPGDNISLSAPSPFVAA